MIIAILWVLCSGLCAYIAHCTNRSVVLWAVIGLAFGLLGLVAQFVELALNGPKDGE